MRVHHHTIGYPPRRVGGTEVHVRDLAEGLREAGHEVSVSYWEHGAGPLRDETETIGGIPIHRLVVPGELTHADDGFGSQGLRREWEALLARLRPDILHLHPLHADEARFFAEGAGTTCPIVCSYHTPTVSCLRGDLLRYGRRVCDGEIRVGRCAACVLNQKGLPLPLAALLVNVARCASRPGAGRGRLASMMRWPQRVDSYRWDLARLAGCSAHMIAGCEWLRLMLMRNGISEQNIAVVRCGRSFAARPSRPSPGTVVRFGFLGRLNRSKGVEVLLDAFARVGREVPLRLEFVSPAFGAGALSADESRLVDRIERLARVDSRCVIRGACAPQDVPGILSEWDALVVPSVWMETGPQVVTEAFFAGTPVIGSRRGGIAELVEEGVGGYLFAAGDTGALAGLLVDLAMHPTRLRAMQERLPGPATREAMVSEMEAVYRKVL